MLHYFKKVLLGLACVISIAFQNAYAEKNTCHQITSELRKKIDILVDEHVQAHYRADAAGAVALYADDIWIMWKDGYEERGRNRIEITYAESYKTVKIRALTYTVDEFIVCGDVAYEVGRLTITTESDGKSAQAQDRYMAVWRLQQNNNWKLHRVVGHQYVSHDE